MIEEKESGVILEKESAARHPARGRRGTGRPGGDRAEEGTSGPRPSPREDGGAPRGRGLGEGEGAAGTAADLPVGLPQDRERGAERGGVDGAGVRSGEVPEPRPACPIEHRPGDAAPFDFGQHPVEVAGSVRRVPFVASVFPESTRRVPFACPAEDEHCLFDAIECADRKATGGIVERSTLEDTKLLVAQVLEGHLREETEAEKRFRVLLGVTPRFTNVSAGSEKGQLERSVGWAKRQVFPDLEVASSEELGKAPDEACEEDARTRRHGPERKLLEELFEEEGSSCGRRPSSIAGSPSRACRSGSRGPGRRSETRRASSSFSFRSKPAGRASRSTSSTWSRRRSGRGTRGRWRAG